MISKNTDQEAALSLLSAQAVRSRAHMLFAAGQAGKLSHFDLDMARMPELAAFVAKIVRQNYPSLDVPFHARWRHFVVDGVDRWKQVQSKHSWRSTQERARAEFDLAIVSVLLDAGAGSEWRYTDRATGRQIGRSEGLAIASLDMFAAGAFSSMPGEPFRADARKLAFITPDDIRTGFQVSSANPLEGVEGRAALLNALGRVVAGNPEIFAQNDTARPGGLFDALKSVADEKGELPATAILHSVLLNLGAIWPSRLSLGDVPLGDTWRHALVVTGDATDTLVPFHKLSQWLSYSLIEPLCDGGISVADIDGLTGLAEYRNGGLFVDGSVIVPRDAAILSGKHSPDSAVVVEWRALTVALLDELAPLVRAELGKTAVEFPLAKMLEGGTWAAGRILARERRADGGPPVAIVSDGTVF